MITDGCQHVSFPFRTVRVGTKKLYGLGPNHPMKFDRRKLKLTVRLQLDKTVETTKLIIPCKHITEFSTFMGRGCPVVWLRTTEECAKHVRKVTRMARGTVPSPYYDPNSRVMAERYIGIIIDLDPIPHNQLFNFKQIIKSIYNEQDLSSEEDFHKRLSQADSNIILMEVTGVSDSITALRKKIAQSPKTDVWKNITKKMKNSSSLIPESLNEESSSSQIQETGRVSKKSKKVSSDSSDQETTQEAEKHIRERKARELDDQEALEPVSNEETSPTHSAFSKKRSTVKSSVTSGSPARTDTVRSRTTEVTPPSEISPVRNEETSPTHSAFSKRRSTVKSSATPGSPARTDTVRLRTTEVTSPPKVSPVRLRTPEVSPPSRSSPVGKRTDEVIPPPKSSPSKIPANIDATKLLPTSGTIAKSDFSNVPSTSGSSVKSGVTSPNAVQRNLNRARKSVPKSNRSISLECQLDEIRAKAAVEQDMPPVIDIQAMQAPDSPMTPLSITEQLDNGSDDSASTTVSITKKKRPKDPFLWKGRTKKRYKKSSTDHKMMYQPPGSASPIVGQALKTSFSTISASASNAPEIQPQSIDDEIETTDQMAESPSTIEKCKCLEKSPHILLTGIEPIKCMGIDSIDGRLSKCTNIVKTAMMMRPSTHTPPLALCEEHRERMLRHECCPGCGMFCAGGTYYLCIHVTECPHRFHKDCMLLHNQTKHCLHCIGSMTGVREVTVQPRQEYKLRWTVAGLDPNKMETKRLQGNREKTARMGHRPTYHQKVPHDGVIKTLRPDIIIDTSELPKGKDRDTLEETLHNYFETVHKKLKIHPKNVFQIVQQGALMKLVQFFHEGEDTDIRNLLKNPSTLIRTVCNDNIAMIYLLKLVGIKFNMADTKGKTALFYAEEKENVELMNFLIASGADVTHRDNEGMTCMHQAAKNGRIVSCSVLLSHSSKLINMEDEGGWTPIVWASEHRHTSTAKYLEYFGADLSKTDKEENMCLHWAALSGNLDLIIMCLQRNSDINFRNFNGDTALHIAARQDHAECVLCLINWGLDHTIKNYEGKTALEYTFPDSDSQVLLEFKHKVHEAMSKPNKRDNVATEKLMSADLSKGFENVPVSCVNSVDDAVCPTEATDGFHYVTANVHTSSETIVKNPTNKMQSCYCYTECNDGSCLCGVMSGRCWYNREGQLIPEFDFIDAPYIVECSETCWCPPSCHNRVVQKGIRYHLQVHRTRSMGWSVRALDTIPRGAFVCEYVGELISDAEADIREDDSYLFDLENSDGEIFCIDARYYGNVSRFINHLCNPNLMPLRVFIDHHDKRFPRLAYFSTREIKAGEELGFDYGNRFWDIKCRSFTCGCGLPQCKYSEEAYRIRKELEEKNSADTIQNQ